MCRPRLTISLWGPHLAGERGDLRPTAPRSAEPEEW